MQNLIFLFLHASNLKVVHAESDFPVFACKQFESRACRILIFHFHMYASKKSCMQNSHFPFSHVRFQNCVHVEFPFSDFACTLPKSRACRISIFRFHMYASKSRTRRIHVFSFCVSAFEMPYTQKSLYVNFTCMVLKCCTRRNHFTPILRVWF